MVQIDQKNGRRYQIKDNVEVLIPNDFIGYGKQEYGNRGSRSEAVDKHGPASL
jgi:hypothetical protein